MGGIEGHTRSLDDGSYPEICILIEIHVLAGRE